MVFVYSDLDPTCGQAVSFVIIISVTFGVDNDGYLNLPILRSHKRFGNI